MTGSYNNSFKIYDVAKQSETTIELSKSKPKPGTTRPIHGATAGGGGGFGGMNGDVMMGGVSGSDFHSAPPVDVDDIDFSKKVLHYSWHPKEDIVAVCGCNNLFLFAAGGAGGGGGGVT